MHSYFYRSFVVFLAMGSVSGTGAHAASLSDLRFIDRNENEKIDAGSERQAALRLTNLDQRQKILLSIDFPQDGMLIVDLTPPPPVCGDKAKFFLRNSAGSLVLTNPSSRSPGSKTAKVSLTNNALANSSKWSLNAALIYRWGINCHDAGKGFALDKSAYAVFGEIAASGEDPGDNKNKATFGLIGEWQYAQGGLVDTQLFSISPYIQTDYEGDSRIFGLRGSWTPLDTKLGLGISAATDRFRKWWSFKGLIDAQSVNAIQGTEFQDTGTNIWVGAKIGFDLEYDLNGFGELGTVFANASVAGHVNVIDDDTTLMRSAEFGIYLDENRNSSISIKHDQGRDYADNKKLKETTLAFGLKF